MIKKEDKKQNRISQLIELINPVFYYIKYASPSRRTLKPDPQTSPSRKTLKPNPQKERPSKTLNTPFKIASSVSIDEAIVVSGKRAVVLGRRTINGPGAILPI